MYGLLDPSDLSGTVPRKSKFVLGKSNFQVLATVYFNWSDRSPRLRLEKTPTCISNDYTLIYPANPSFVIEGVADQPWERVLFGL